MLGKPGSDGVFGFVDAPGRLLREIMPWAAGCEATEVMGGKLTW